MDNSHSQKDKESELWFIIVAKLTKDFGKMI